MLIQKYYDVSVSRNDARKDILCNRRWGAHFKLDADTRELFPYINSVLKGARYTVRPLCVKFGMNDNVCTLYPMEAMAAPFSGRDQAYAFIENLVVFLNDLHARRGAIEPNYKIYQNPVSVIEIVKILPRNNCKACGFSTCMAFAAALSTGKILPEKCPEFPQPISVSSVYPVIDRHGILNSTLAIEIDGIKNANPNNKPHGQDISPPSGINKLKQEVGSLVDYYGIRIQKNLTHREIQVLRMVAEGASNPEISDRMGISHHTVKSHVIHIFNKISANDRTQAAVWAVRNKVV
jgi:DNA-binding CsgD family transcriptional regulator/ArsR family metal-binding transcriptional regulator